MNFKSSNFKIYLGSVYVAVLLAVVYFLFSNFDVSDLTSYEFIRENKGLILKYKESNIFFLTIIFFIIAVLCICIFSDIGGYVFGKVIGGKKLTTISPNKTISGSLGSFIFSTLPVLLFNLQNFTGVSFEGLSINIELCLIVSLVCQLGDLLISYFKRLNKVKDTGTILPGHGGLLDRIDGLIFAIPTVYILKITQVF